MKYLNHQRAIQLKHHLLYRLQIRQIPLEGEWAIISKRIKVPIEPMIGCIGLAPASGSSSTVKPAYPWGGNLDLRELGSGGTIYLPVQTPGALLSIGDLHAAMGTAEPTAVSLEGAGQVAVRITVKKGKSLKPWLRKHYKSGEAGFFPAANI